MESNFWKYKLTKVRLLSMLLTLNILQIMKIQFSVNGFTGSLQNSKWIWNLCKSLVSNELL